MDRTRRRREGLVQKVDKIRKDEVRKALKRMKSGKAVGPDDIPVEVWKCLGEAAVEFLTSLFNRVLESKRMPEEWRSVLVPIFKNKGDVQSCSNYRGIKLMSHTKKLWERVVEARLRKVVEICEQQYGFMPRKSTTDAIFALRILMEKYRDGLRELHCVFVDLEKAYDRVPREELWYCMRKSGVAEKYVRVVQDMYERSRTVVRCAVGQTEEFKVEVGLHQGSALSPFLFAIVMDQLSEEVRQESPWTMMFADDIVICSESREQVEENLERWRFALERRGMKVSRSKTEYMCVNEREGGGTVRLQGEEVKKVQEFKYLGSTVQSNGECGKEVKKRLQAGWNGWRKVSGVLCDRKISARIKGKVYRTVVRPAMLYNLETVSLRKRQESELEVAELKMLRFSLGVTRLDRIRNKYIRGTAHVGRLGDKVREVRLRWFGHVQRRESEYIDRRMLDMELPGRRQRGRPKRRYMDGINEDMKLGHWWLSGGKAFGFLKEQQREKLEEVNRIREHVHSAMLSRKLWLNCDCMIISEDGFFSLDLTSEDRLVSLFVGQLKKQEFMEDQKYRDEEDLAEKLDSFKTPSSTCYDPFLCHSSSCPNNDLAFYSHLLLAAGCGDKYAEFDLNDEGEIDMMGLKRMMEKLGVPKTHLEMKKMISEVTGGSSETINYRDFVKMMLGKRSAVLKLVMMFEDKANSPACKPDGPPPKRDIASLP
ncbi:hypothetical protein QTP86_020250 [Hemibagrus guttatus]|nr:hypothetical protein QTP86_020250 [Hemibagrus guttatus]